MIYVEMKATGANLRGLDGPGLIALTALSCAMELVSTEMYTVLPGLPLFSDLKDRV